MSQTIVDMSGVITIQDRQLTSLSQAYADLEKKEKAGAEELKAAGIQIERFKKEVEDLREELDAAEKRSAELDGRVKAMEAAAAAAKVDGETGD